MPRPNSLDDEYEALQHEQHHKNHDEYECKLKGAPRPRDITSIAGVQKQPEGNGNREQEQHRDQAQNEHGFMKRFAAGVAKSNRLRLPGEESRRVLGTLEADVLPGAALLEQTAQKHVVQRVARLVAAERANQGMTE